MIVSSSRGSRSFRGFGAALPPPGTMEVPGRYRDDAIMDIDKRGPGFKAAYLAALQTSADMDQLANVPEAADLRTREAQLGAWIMENLAKYDVALAMSMMPTFLVGQAQHDSAMKMLQDSAPHIFKGITEDYVKFAQEIRVLLEVLKARNQPAPPAGVVTVPNSPMATQQLPQVLQQGADAVRAAQAAVARAAGTTPIFGTPGQGSDPALPPPIHAATASMDWWTIGSGIGLVGGAFLLWWAKGRKS